MSDKKAKPPLQLSRDMETLFIKHWKNQLPQRSRSKFERKKIVLINNGKSILSKSNNVYIAYQSEPQIFKQPLACCNFTNSNQSSSGSDNSNLSRLSVSNKTASISIASHSESRNAGSVKNSGQTTPNFR